MVSVGKKGFEEEKEITQEICAQIDKVI